MLLASGLYGYAALSAVVTGAVVANAVTAREQFYSTVVHLTTSKGSLLAVANMVIVLGVLIGQLVKVLFLGTLRDSEVEHLNERIWPTITDTLLMMTMFRDEIGFLWGALFGLLIFFRVFAWLAADRVAYIEVNPNMSRGSYLRLFAMLVTFIVVDGGFLYFCVNETLEKGPSQLIMFGFEYTLVLISLVVSLVKYAFNVVDARSANGWDNKGVSVLYLDFTSDLLRLLTYVSFFGIVCHYYGLPLHIVRQTWLSFRSFRKSLEAVSKYRRATENMDLRFPDATATDLQRFDSTCIVCRDEIQEGGKKLPCQHILHKKCLTRWLERSHTCPICSASVFVEDNNFGPNAHRNQLNEEEWGDMAAQNVNHNNAQHGAGAGAGAGNNAGEEEREPIERPHNGEGGAQQGGNFVHMPAVMAEMPQVVTPGGQIDAERLLEHMQLLQEQIGLLSDQVALLQAQLLSTLPANAPQPQRGPATPQRTSLSPVAPAPAHTEVAPAPAPAATPAATAVAPQTVPSPSLSEGRASLSSSMPVTQDEREQRTETKEDGGSGGGGGGASPAAQRSLEDSPLDEIRRRRLQRFRSSAGPDA